MYQHIFEFKCVVTTHINLTIFFYHVNHYPHGTSNFVTKTNSQPSLSLSACSYHVKYAFQSESALYRCMNVKKHLAQNMRDIWN